MAKGSKNPYLSNYAGLAKKGDPGFSAYYIAVQLGFHGTETEWIASLKGDKGDPGKDGSGTGGNSNSYFPSGW